MNTSAICPFSNVELPLVAGCGNVGTKRRGRLKTGDALRRPLNGLVAAGAGRRHAEFRDSFFALRFGDQFKVGPANEGAPILMYWRTK